jgi:O-antigen/teichoic acid export membrane protein
VTLITFPLLVWLGFNAKTFVALILGTRWLPAVLPLRFLCLMTAVKILTNVVAQMMAAVGYPKLVLRNDLLTALVLPLAFLYGCTKGGLLGLGIAWCTVFPVLRLQLLVAAWRQLRFSPIAYLESLFDAIWLSMLCLVLMCLAQSANDDWRLLGTRSLLWLLAVGVAIGLTPRLRQLIREAV